MSTTLVQCAWRALSIIALLGALTRTAPGESVTPPVVGSVRDSSGSPLANVTVTIAELRRSVTSDGAGRFVFRSLPAGTYHLDAYRIGYAPAHAVVTVPESGDSVAVAIVMRASPLTLPSVQVTATPLGHDALDITRSALELSGAALARNLTASVAQTLSSSPGMSVRYAGPAASTPVIRGLEGERILVLQDGQRTGDLSSTSSDHGLTADPLAASRIEVVRGPASLLYGNNALGGVVNILSDDIPGSVPAGLEGRLSLQTESVNPGASATVRITAPLGERLVISGRGGGRDVDEVRLGGGGRLTNSQFRNVYGVLGLAYVGAAVSGGLSYRGYTFDYGLPFPPDAEEAGVTIEGERHELVGRLDLSLAERGVRQMHVDGTAQTYTHDEIEDNGQVGTTFELSTQTVSATARTQLARLEGAIGVSGLFKQYEPVGEEALTPQATSRSGGLFVYQEIPLGAPVEGEERSAHLEVGARYDIYRIESRDAGEPFADGRTREFKHVSGSLGVSIPLSETSSLALSVARAFRAPTVEELFSNAFHVAAGTFDVGNPELDAEVNQGFDVVLRSSSERVTAQFGTYFNQIDDYIAPLTVGDTTILDEEEGEEITIPLVNYARRDARLYGAEASVELEVADNLVLGAMADAIRGRFRGTRDPIPFMPAARVGASARWDDGRFSFGAEVRHGFRQDAAQQRGALNETVAGDYTLMNLSAGITLTAGGRLHTITLRADNVSDERYIDATSRIKAFAPNPGRNVALVYQLAF